MPLGLLVYPSINLLMNFPLGSLRFACQQALVYVACTNVLLLKSEWNEEKGSTKRRAVSQDATVIRPPWSIGRTVRTIPDDLSVGVIAIGWQQVLKGSLHAGIPMDGKCRQDDSDNNRHVLIPIKLQAGQKPITLVAKATTPKTNNAIIHPMLSVTQAGCHRNWIWSAPLVS